MKVESCDAAICNNDVLTDDCLRAILSKLPTQSDKNAFGLVCKRWLVLQSSERLRMGVRAGPHMLQRVAARFTHLLDLDFTQSVSRSFYPGVSDNDLLTVSKSFRFLERLNLRECKGITDAGLSALGSGLPALNWIDLSDCKRITDKGVELLVQGHPHLQSLYVSGCKLLTDKSLEQIGKCCKHLKELNFHSCVNVGDVGLVCLLQCCTSLQLLDMSMCSKISMGGQNIAVRCIQLRSLNVSSCSKIRDAGIENLAKKCVHMELVMLNGCRMVSDEGVKQLVRQCGSTLKVLELGWVTNISDEAVTWIFTHCSVIESLDLESCTNVSGSCFMELRSISPLKHLKLNNCNSLTIASIVKIAEFCTCLEKLELRYCSQIDIDLVRDLTFPEGCQLLL